MNDSATSIIIHHKSFQLTEYDKHQASRCSIEVSLKWAYKYVGEEPLIFISTKNKKKLLCTSREYKTWFLLWDPLVLLFLTNYLWVSMYLCFLYLSTYVYVCACVRKHNFNGFLLECIHHNNNKQKLVGETLGVVEITQKWL